MLKRHCPPMPEQHSGKETRSLNPVPWVKTNHKQWVKEATAPQTASLWWHNLNKNALFFSLFCFSSIYTVSKQVQYITRQVLDKVLLIKTAFTAQNQHLFWQNSGKSMSKTGENISYILQEISSFEWSTHQFRAKLQKSAQAVWDAQAAEPKGFTPATVPVYPWNHHYNHNGLFE